MALALGWTGYADTDLVFAEFFGGDHTLSLRFMPQYPRAYEGPCIAENGSGTFFLGQGIYDGETASTKLLLAVGAKSVVMTALLVAGRWHHVALTAQSGATQRTFKLFLDGTAIGELPLAAGDRGLPQGTLRFGKRTAGKTVNERNAQCYGLLADIAVFGRALGTSAIGALASNAAHLTGAEGDLIAGFTFAEGWQPAKLARKTTLHGAAASVAISGNWNHANDAKQLLQPSHHQPMDLPIPLAEPWIIRKGWDADGHNDDAAFCWDFYIDGPTAAEYPQGSDGAPFYAAAPGIVRTATQGASSGVNAGEYSNLIDIEQAPNEFASYLHLRKSSLLVKKDQRVTMHERLALTGDTGTPVGEFHLHFAVNDKPDNTAGFVTFPVAFSDYEVRGAFGVWQPVARGIPGKGQVVRNPPTPLFGARSLTPESTIVRASDHLNVVATDRNGRRWMSRWTPDRYARNWDRWRPVLRDLGGARPIAVVSRAKDQLDVVTTDAVGRIHTGARNDKVDHGLWGGWWQIRDLMAKPDSPVAIVARDATKLDVFAVRMDGAISGAAWDRDVAGGEWRGWWSIASGKTHPGSPITAIARSPHQLDLFVTGIDGGVYTAGWDKRVDDGKWHGWSRVGNLVTVAGARITAVARDPRKLDIFAVRRDIGLYGAVCTAAWDRDVAGGQWRGWWPITDAVTLAGAPVSVVSRAPDRLDVFITGKDGGVYSAAWDAQVAQGAWRGWWRIRDLVSYPGSAVAAVARESGKMDIFAVRTDGRMSTAAWDRQVAGGEWRGWWGIL